MHHASVTRLVSTYPYGGLIRDTLYENYMKFLRVNVLLNDYGLQDN